MKRILLVMMTMFVATLISGTALAHFEPSYHSVATYGNREVVVYREAVPEQHEDIVRYGIRQWQDLDGKGHRGQGVRFVPAENTDRPTTLVITNLVYDNDHLGLYWSSTTPDRIEINWRLMARDDDGLRRKVVVHEVGHAIDLEHPPVTEHYRRTSVMYNGDNAIPFQRPQSHDIRDYQRRWMR